MSDAGKWDVWYRGLAGWCATFRAGHCGVDDSQSPFADDGQEHVFLIERPPPPA